MFGKEDVATTFFFKSDLYVVTHTGTIWRFMGFNTWQQVAYLPNG